MINIPENVIEMKKIVKKRGMLMPKKKEKRVKFRVNDQWLTVEECIARGLKITIKKDGKFVEVTSNREVLEHLEIQNNKSCSISSTKTEDITSNTQEDKSMTELTLDSLDLNDKLRNSNKVITKEDLEERIQKLREKLEFMYSDSELMDTTATIHKEGQMYAYKSLLRQLSEK